jgi:DNA polymerase-1
MPKLLALDCETNGTALYSGCRPFAVSTCDDKGNTCWWEWKVDPFTRSVAIPCLDRHEIIDLIGSADRLIFHNATFDIKALSNIGYEFQNYFAKNPLWDKLDDTLGMSHVLNSRESHNLKDLALKYLDFPDDDERELAKEVQRLRRVGSVAKKAGWNLAEEWQWDYWLPKAADPKSTLLSRYGVNDAIRTMRLYIFFKECLALEGLSALYERERRLIPVTNEMQEAGLCTHKMMLHREIRRYKSIQSRSKEKIVRCAKRFGFDGEFNPNSHQQLSKLFFGKLRMPVIKRGKPNKQTGESAPSTDKDVLKAWWLRIGNECNEEGGEREYVKDKSDRAILIDTLLTNRNANSAVNYSSDYLRGSRLEDRQWIIHPSLNQWGTVATRYSSSDPNAQNVSLKAEMPLRMLFGPRSGCFWYDIDYSNLEWRIMAYLAKEEKLIAAFERGESIHLAVAMEMWNLPGDQLKDKCSPHHWKYKRTKNFDFAVPYGAGEKRGDDTAGMAGAYQRFRQRFVGVSSLMDETISDAKRKGYTTTLSGYRIPIDRERPYSAFNNRIQGSAGDIIKEAMLNLKYNERCQYVSRTVPRPKIVLQVHDELILELPADLKSNKSMREWIVEQMEEPGQRYGIPTPVSVSVVTKKWSEPKEIEV